MREVVDGLKELSNQIAKVMAALTRAEQGNHPVSAPNRPRHRGHGEDGQIGSLLPTQAPTMVGLAWVRLPLLTAPLLQVGYLKVRGAPKDPKMVRAVYRI